MEFASSLIAAVASSDLSAGGATTEQSQANQGDIHRTISKDG